MTIEELKLVFREGPQIYKERYKDNPHYQEFDDRMWANFVSSRVKEALHLIKKKNDQAKATKSI